MKGTVSKIGLAVLAIFFATGCSSMTPKDEKNPEVYRIATRKIAPEPVYNRLTLVYLPDTLPERGTPSTVGGPINPLIHFDVKDMRLEQAAKVLAKSTQYRSFCASKIVNQKLTLNRIGTVDELGEAISKEAGIKVVVDHEGQAIRFFPQTTETPKFLEDGAKIDAK